MSEARSVSFALIFLLLCGTAYRYTELAATHVPPAVFGGGAPDTLISSLTADLSSTFGESLSSSASSPLSSTSLLSSSDTDVKARKERLAALRAENEKLRATQEAMLASIGSGATAAAADVAASGAAGGAAAVSTAPLNPLPPPPVEAPLPPPPLPSPDLDAAAAAASVVPSGLRGGGLGGAAERALALATSFMGPSTASAAPAQPTSARRAPSLMGGTPPPLPASPPPSSSPGAAVGSTVAFRMARGGRYLTVDDKGWLTVDMDGSSPLATRAFTVVDGGDRADGGWVGLRLWGTGQLMEMVPKSQPLAWVVRASGPPAAATVGADAALGGGARLPERQQWRVEGGRVLNRESGAYVNVISGAHAVRGHGNDPNKARAAAASEPSTRFAAEAVTEDSLAQDRDRVAIQKKAEHSSEDAYIAAIAKFPTSSEKRVVSYGLYGSNPKYTIGAVRNAELVKVYFPGWIARFYCDKTVPTDILRQLKALGAEIVEINDIKGGIAGMFWRFLVADDPTVDRYIVRDSDSRLNARERFAVEDWIRSGKGVHSIRDHPNHERPLNGGMWGGVHGAVKGMGALVKKYSNKGKYGGDLTFLTDKVWPQVKANQISHDAYSCHKFPNAHPFPTKRPANYQHVGQVFFENGKWRQGDIDGFMRGREVPVQCRKKPDWKYG